MSEKLSDKDSQKIVDEMASEFDRIYTHLLENADELHKSLQSNPMTDAEVWESLIPPFED